MDEFSGSPCEALELRHAERLCQELVAKHWCAQIKLPMTKTPTRRGRIIETKQLLFFHRIHDTCAGRCGQAYQRSRSWNVTACPQCSHVHDELLCAVFASRVVSFVWVYLLSGHTLRCRVPDLHRGTFVQTFPLCQNRIVS